MKWNVLRSTWGMPGPVEAQLAQIAAEGYDGVECGLPEPQHRARLLELLKQHQLIWQPMLFSDGKTAQEHVALMDRHMGALAEMGAKVTTAHSAKDHWPMDEQKRYFAATIELEAKHGIQIAHETHRGRALYNPWETAALLREFPTLKLCADLSHWTCVCESLLHSQDADLAIVFERVIHIHCRVGYEEGPQVPDPEAPEYAGQRAAFEGWWKKMGESMAKRGMAVGTVTPEYGPPNYLHTLPHTNVPVGNLDTICKRAAERWRTVMA
jgi:sugar phosphate isomerase/epimerase